MRPFVLNKKQMLPCNISEKARYVKNDYKFSFHIKTAILISQFLYTDENMGFNEGKK